MLGHPFLRFRRWPAPTPDADMGRPPPHRHCEPFAPPIPEPNHRHQERRWGRDL